MGMSQPTGALSRLNFTIKQSLWTLALALALMKTKLGFFYRGMNRDGTLKNQGQPFIPARMNPANKPPAHGSEERFPRDPGKEPDFSQHSSTNCNTRHEQVFNAHELN